MQRHRLVGLHLLIAANEHQGGEIDGEPSEGNNRENGGGKKHHYYPYYNLADETTDALQPSGITFLFTAGHSAWLLFYLFFYESAAKLLKFSHFSVLFNKKVWRCNLIYYLFCTFAAKF